MIIFMILGFLAGIRSVYSITKSFYAKDLKKKKKIKSIFQIYTVNMKRISPEADKTHISSIGGRYGAGNKDIS